MESFCFPLVHVVVVMSVLIVLETYVLPVMAISTSLMLSIVEFVYMIKMVNSLECSPLLTSQPV